MCCFFNNKENDIFDDACYLISRFNLDNKRITQLQVQRLMYLVEALYCNVKDTPQMYKQQFNAWCFGPVSVDLYRSLRIYGHGDIDLIEEHYQNIEYVSLRNKLIINKIYELCKDLTPMQLVKITTMEGSPWEISWGKNNHKVVYGKASYISKKNTKKWFKKHFMGNE